MHYYYTTLRKKINTFFVKMRIFVRVFLQKVRFGRHFYKKRKSRLSSLYQRTGYYTIKQEYSLECSCFFDTVDGRETTSSCQRRLSFPLSAQLDAPRTAGAMLGGVQSPTIGTKKQGTLRRAYPDFSFMWERLL